MTKTATRDTVFSIAAPAITPVTSVASTDIITATAHGFVAGDAVVFNSLTGGAGLVVGKRYYVIATNLAANTFMVSATVGGATFDHSTNITAGAVAKFNAVGQVTALAPVGSSRDLIEASAYGDAWKDYVVGQQDGSEMDFEVALDNTSTGHVAVKAAYDAGVAIRFGLTNTAANFDVAFPAMLTKWERGTDDLQGVMKGAGTLKILNPGVTDTP